MGLFKKKAEPIAQATIKQQYARVPSFADLLPCYVAF